MAIIRNEESVRIFYEDAITNMRPNNENLTGPVSIDFEQMVNNISVGKYFTALDLGYGYGNYSMMLARRGYRVHALDYISPECFQRRMAATTLADRIRIINMDLKSFVPNANYNFVVAKDVLHFLPKAKVESLLSQLIQVTEKYGWHYIVVFTDIKRVSDQDEEITIENEARFEKDYLLGFLQKAYKGWKVIFKIEEYKEGDRTRYESKYYFSSQRITLIASNS